VPSAWCLVRNPRRVYAEEPETKLLVKSSTRLV